MELSDYIAEMNQRYPEFEIKEMLQEIIPSSKNS